MQPVTRMRVTASQSVMVAAAVRLAQEVEYGRGVEVKHLRSGKLAIPHLVQAHGFHVQPLSV